MEQSKTQRNKEVASTILQQLGGNKFIVMTGAKDLVFSSGRKNCGALEFRIGRNSSKANKICIELRPDDTYDMTFFRYAKMELKELKKHEGIYFDQLQELFTEFTGMYTRLF